jgi:hypothetical protein
MRSAVPFALALTSCYAGNFQTLTSPFVGTHAQVGCLDVAVALTDDAKAPAPIVAYQFGNRCAHQTIVDFTAVHVFVTGAGGSHIELHPYDPKQEIRPMQLDAFTSGDERIAYNALWMSPPVGVCIDLGGLDRDQPTQVSPICLGVDAGGPP